MRRVGGAGAEVTGARVAGADVAGAEVGVAGVAGAGVGVAGVAGVEVAGVEVAGADVVEVTTTASGPVVESVAGLEDEQAAAARHVIVTSARRVTIIRAVTITDRTGGSS